MHSYWSYVQQELEKADNKNTITSETIYARPYTKGSLRCIQIYNDKKKMKMHIASFSPLSFIKSG